MQGFTLNFLKPVNIEAPGPAIINFHGYSGSSGDWQHYLGYAASGLLLQH